MPVRVPPRSRSWWSSLRSLASTAGWRALIRIALFGLVTYAASLLSRTAHAETGAAEARPTALPEVLAPFVEQLEADGYVTDDDAALLPYQRAWAYDRSRVKVGVKSRRIGFTWATAYEAVEVGSARRECGGMDVWYMANAADDAREFIDDCADWVAWLRPFIHEVASAGGVQQEVLVYGDESVLAFTISFASGYKIHALTSKPRRLRGKQGYAILDEAAFHDNLGEWLKAALPFLTWGGRVAVISTLNGVESAFWDLVEACRSGKKKYSLHSVDIHTAVRQGLYKRICRKQGIPWSPEGEVQWLDQLREDNGDGWEEEYECIPRRSGGAYIPQHLIHSRMKLGPSECKVLEFKPSRDMDKATWGGADNWDDVPVDQRNRDLRRWLDSHLLPYLQTIKDMEMYGGVDFGRTANLTVLKLLTLERDMTRRVRLVVELDNVPFAQQDQVLDYVWERCKGVRKVYLDATGIGRAPAEHARDQLGRRAEMVTLSDGWYSQHWPPLKQRFEDGAILLPTYEPLFDDLRSLRRIGGKVKIAGEGKGNDGKQKRHGDGAIALLLAEAACGTKAEAANTSALARWGRSKKKR